MCVGVKMRLGTGGCVWRGRFGGRGCVCGGIEGILGGVWVWMCGGGGWGVKDVGRCVVHVGMYGVCVSVHACSLQ